MGGGDLSPSASAATASVCVCASKQLANPRHSVTFCVHINVAYRARFVELWLAMAPSNKSRRDAHSRSGREMARWWMAAQRPLFHASEEVLACVATRCVAGSGAYVRGGVECARAEPPVWHKVSLVVAATSDYPYMEQLSPGQLPHKW